MSASGELRRGQPLQPAEPLWQRAPQCDDSGQPTSDFMMVIPGLGTRPAPVIERIVTDIGAVLRAYGNVVLFADLNLRINVLWVSVRPLPGVCLELAAAIHGAVPEAKLVAPVLAGARR